jgi:hypothetical protein
MESRKMPNKESRLKPLHFLWSHSQLLQPARTLTEQAEDWTDLACAVGYLVFLVYLVHGVAVTFSWSSIFGLGGIAAAIIVTRLVIRHLS